MAYRSVSVARYHFGAKGSRAANSLGSMGIAVIFAPSFDNFLPSHCSSSCSAETPNGDRIAWPQPCSPRNPLGLLGSHRRHLQHLARQRVIALANHRKAIRSEIAAYARRHRQIDLDVLSRVLTSYGVSPERWPPVTIILAVPNREVLPAGARGRQLMQDVRDGHGDIAR